MPIVDAVVQTPLLNSFRVQQVAGVFDMALTPSVGERFTVEVPGLDEDWRIGLIVGPSGSGKSTVARHAWPDALHEFRDWPAKAAVVDCFGEHNAKTITQALTSVGLSSPPKWVRPYHVLSNGEKFRCELARVLLDDAPLVVFDEYTSVVDRTVAKVASVALSKAVRRSPSKRFVAVSCHYDIAEWLTADWVLDMAVGRLARGRLQRPPIELSVFRCHHSAWSLFGKHHYLTNDLNRSAVCYLATWGSEPVAFVAMLPAVGRSQRGRRISRIVVLPDYQGIGVGGRVLDAVAGLWPNDVFLKTSHPSLMSYCSRSRNWKCFHVNQAGRKLTDARKKDFGSTRVRTRMTASFRYVGPRVSS